MNRSDTTPSEIHLHIGELVVDGLPGVSPEVLGAAVQRELTRLLTEGPLPNSLGQGGHVASVPGGTVQVSARPDAARLGAQIAENVYGGLNR